VSTRRIGERLFIGERTVETHLSHAYAKLGVRTRFELIAEVAGAAPDQSR
jgi:DNA-binding CsgD family transcriptional regulator